ncbi:hypothetical protein MVEN_00049700 [Mycena venus]|uniref:Mid2 domain-containing protein n=1 Tax=Mycena venus TaxID=2733690 RepID=A0A8H7DEZ6_9AGAR|nr:hypothetical protein MVEN_00049700 [Mycena venus]
MVLVLFIYVLAVFCPWGCASLVNRTIEDFDPLVQYNCTVTHCDTAPNPCVSADASFNRTLTRTGAEGATSCQITIPFSGEILRVPQTPNLMRSKALPYMLFLAAEQKRSVNLTLTKPEHMPTFFLLTLNLSRSPVCPYYNTSLSNRTHTLVITASDELLVDFFIYTIDDGVTPVASGGTSGSTPIPTTSISPPPETSSVDPTVNKKTTPLIGGIVGGTIGGLALVTVMAGLFAVFKRRSARRKHVPGSGFTIDEFDIGTLPSTSDPVTNQVVTTKNELPPPYRVN